MFPEFETDRLRLIEINQSHKESYYSLMSDHLVTQYYGMDRLENMNEAITIIERFQSNYINKRGIRWGILLKENNRFIGTVGLNGLNLAGRKAEIGYEIHPDFWRNGITTEAVMAILNFAFAELDLYRIGAVTFTENQASQGLLKKVGFQEEGRLRGYLFQNKQNHDGVVFSLLKNEWRDLNE